MIRTYYMNLIQQLLPAYNNIGDAQQAAAWLLEAITKKSFVHLLAHDYRLTESEQVCLEEAIKQHVYEHKPLQYIIGSVPFLHVDILVKPPILIPRPETEEWCALLIDKLKPVADLPLIIADVGTGSGCIALVLAKALPNATVYALDTNEQALTLTKDNAVRNNISNVVCLASDLLSAVQQSSFDLIVSNPPYISDEEYALLAPSVTQWEDKGALTAPNEGLALLDALIKQASRQLRHNEAFASNNIPNLVLEFGYKQADAVHALLLKQGFSDIHIHQDIFGNNRAAFAYLAT